MVGVVQWIGATECATLLRHSGLAAQIVDFHGNVHSNRYPQLEYCVKSHSVIYKGLRILLERTSARMNMVVAMVEALLLSKFASLCLLATNLLAECMSTSIPVR